MPEKTSAPTRRSIGQVLQDWDPDRHWHVPLILIFLVYAIGWAPALGGLPFWTMLLAGIAVTMLGVVAARSIYPEHIFGPHQHSGVRALIGSAGLSATAWWVACSQVILPWWEWPDTVTHTLLWEGWTPVTAPALWSLALGGLIHGVWFAILDARAPVAQEQTLQETAHRMENYAERQLQTDWIEIMEMSGFPEIVVMHHEETDAGYAVGIAPGNPRKTFTYGALNKAAESIAVNASMVLSRDGGFLPADAIRVEETGAAHVSIIHVKTKALLVGDIEYEPTMPTPRATDPKDFGKYETGGKVKLSLHDTHGAVVGATGSGKSVYTNVLIGRATESPDMDTWLLATDKLVPMAYPWIKPWLQGLTDRPIFGVVAGQDPQQVLQALAWAYLEMRRRNARLSNKPSHVCTPAEPAIKIVIEETADVMQRTDTIILPDGREVTASKLVQMIAQAGRSACVTIEFVTQSALYDALGNKGNQTNRNVTRRVALRTMTKYDGQATLVGLNNVDTTQLRDHTMLVQDSIEVPLAVNAKSHYLEGELVEDVVLHNTPNRPGAAYEAGMAKHLGRTYTERWDARNHPELVTAARMDGLDWPVRSGDARPATTNVSNTRTPMDVDDEFARITGPLETELKQMNDAPSTTTTDGLPDVDEDLTELNKLQARTQTPAYRMLNQIMSLLSDPAAPKDFVSTRQLAVVMARIGSDATDEEKDAAAVALGQEISGLIPGLKTKRSRRGGGIRRGYEIARLREVHKALAAGEAIRPDTDE
jgi:hypothetical protein